MRLVDVVSDDDNDVAIVGDKIRKFPASFWTQVGKHRPVEIPNFEHVVSDFEGDTTSAVCSTPPGCKT